jgi:Flp pilus assembly pilin Flp
MKKFLNAFAKDEDGAVTVDWVVLTAAIVGIALGILALISTALTTTATEIAASIDGALT